MKVRTQSGGLVDTEEYQLLEIEHYSTNEKDARQYVSLLVLVKESIIKTVSTVFVGRYTSWADAEQVKLSLVEAGGRGETFFDTSSPSAT